MQNAMSKQEAAVRNFQYMIFPDWPIPDIPKPNPGPVMVEPKSKANLSDTVFYYEREY